MFLQHIAWREAQQKTETDDGDDHVIEVAHHGDEVRYHVNGRGQVEDERRWDDAKGHRDSRVPHEGQRQAQLAAQGQTEYPLDEGALLSTSATPRQPHGASQGNNQDSQADTEGDPEGAHVQ